MSSNVRSIRLFLAAALALGLGCTSSSSLPEGAEPAVPEAEAPQTPVAAVTATLEPVYFDTDMAVLRPEARKALERYARSIIEHPEWGVVRIEGHCDERGSDAYNLALGKRRAAAVERFLVERGVSRSRLATRSLGSMQPAVPGHDEGAWRHNRRSELLGGDALVSAVR